MRIALAITSLLTIVALAPMSASGQETAVRFPVADVSDTTFSFRVGAQRWVRAGMRGIVVDPTQQDILVARFRVTGVSNAGIARAVVTGQTTNLTSAHTVLLDVPRTPWYRQRFLWIGGAVGAVVGFFVGRA